MHSAAAVEEDITVKMNKTLIMDLEPLQDIHYMKIISKSYNIRVTRTNGSSKAIGLVSRTIRRVIEVLYNVARNLLPKEGLEIPKTD